ncbi:hypothetical protein AB0880_27235 [Micromonospora chersina]|uniref:hypothetical protein n=1 Tax=Micromonospora chersina TaxID=47854 RepID=UPI003452A852
MAIARSQLERWTFNVASHHRLAAQGPQESTRDYFRRVWSIYPAVSKIVDVGAAWVILSEWLHGRGGIAEALEYDWVAADLAQAASVSVPDATLRHHALIGSVLTVALMQVRGCAATLALGSGQEDYVKALQVVCTAPATIEDLNVSLLAPLDHIRVFGPTGKQLVSIARFYRQAICHDELREVTTSAISVKLATDATLERRGRAVEREREAWADEAKKLGPELSLGFLAARLFRYCAISEAALIASRWATGKEREALASAAAALRSAFWLWLEDTDVAMTCVRVVLEQTCRARAWRVKPARATRVEAGGGVASPARWVEAAGWKRLGVLSRALGEFAHINVRSRWTGARGALNAIQDPNERWPENTARGNALDSAAYLLAHEVAVRLDAATPTFGEKFRESVTLFDREAHEEHVERLLERGQALKGFDFGEPEFVPAEVLHLP